MPSTFHMSVSAAAAYERVISELVSGNAMVVFTVRGCCICHVVKQLLFGLGVAPAIFEIPGCVGFRRNYQPFPVVFVRGKFLGGIEAVLAQRVSGALAPLLKDAGALWL
ncbi:glutaredoxin-C9-like [Primulina tabacum]|uniref:glutaredoxin-C9-like n=1 Tax=Primulina tabacum TaxID=48773 RepID=UPI003F5AD0D1